jgi:hypothetical protein
MTLFQVTRYDKDGQAIYVSAVEAESKPEAAEKVLGYEVASDVRPDRAVASVVALGEQAGEREYVRRAERQG